MKTQLDSAKTGRLIINGKRYKATHTVTVAGQPVELYKPQVLAAALDRTSRSIRNWEVEGLIPKPLFEVRGIPTEGRRWYSREQIINLWQTHNRFPFSARQHHLREQFFALFNQVFDEGEVIDVAAVPVVERTTEQLIVFNRPNAPTIPLTNDGDALSPIQRARAALTQRRRAAHAPQAARTGQPPTPGAAKPAPSRAVVEASVGRYPAYDVAPERRGHLGHAAGTPIESRGGHATGAHSGTVGKKADYRRRPTGGI